MAEACSGRLQPSMCFSHTVLREYGDLKVSATGEGCAKLKGVTSTPKPRFQKIEAATCLDLPLFIELIRNHKYYSWKLHYTDTSAL